MDQKFSTLSVFLFFRQPFLCLCSDTNSNRDPYPFVGVIESFRGECPSMIVNLSRPFSHFVRSTAIIGLLVNSTIVVVRGNLDVEVKENGL